MVLHREVRRSARSLFGVDVHAFHARERPFPFDLSRAMLLAPLRFRNAARFMLSG